MKRPAAAISEPAEESDEEMPEEPTQEELPSPQSAKPKASPTVALRSPGGQFRAATAAVTPAEESPTAAAKKVMQVVSASSDRPLPASGNRLAVAYEPSEASETLAAGLVRQRRVGHLCDATVIAGGGRISVHRVVLAAHSELFTEKLTKAEGSDMYELKLEGISHESADILVRWLYGEVSRSSYNPATSKVNEEVLQLSSELGLPDLSELCGVHLAAGVDVTNVVSRICLCDKYGLPRLRTSLVQSLAEDSKALHTVARDPETVGHPELMRELLASLAAKATSS
jgi:hypothetical protein